LITHGSAGTPNAWAVPDFSGTLPSAVDLPAFLTHIWTSRSVALKEQFLRFTVAISMHVVADLITLRFGDAGTTTVRGDEGRPVKRAWLKKLMMLYGSYQFLALASHLIPHSRGMDLAYNTLIAIQSSAFGMTLNRKGLIHYTTHAIVYGTCLLISGSYILWTMRSWGFLIAVLAAWYARTQLRVSKYVIWSTYALGFGLGAPLGAGVGASVFIAAGLWANLRKRPEVLKEA